VEETNHQVFIYKFIWTLKSVYNIPQRLKLVFVISGLSILDCTFGFSNVYLIIFEDKI
jgi:hypothetical protein